MRFVYGTHESPEGQRIAEWFGRNVGKEQHPPYSAMGWEDERGLISAVLFNDFNGSNIEFHMVGKNSRQLIRSILRYAFVQLDVQRLTAKPARSNPHMRDVLKRIGFELEGVMKRYYGPKPSDDAFVFRLDRYRAEKWMA